MAEFKHNVEQQRYEVEVAEGFWAHLDYVERDNVLTITHTFVPNELRGQGCGKILMETVLQDVEKQNKKVRAVCSYAVVFLDRQEKWQHLVA